MTGGTVQREIELNENSILNLVGSNFQVIDNSGVASALSQGDRLSNFGTLVETSYYGNYRQGTIVGTLADGSAINTKFILHNPGYYGGTADIVIIPEPATAVLLGLGVLALSRRKTD